jgi:hypothetical protein
VARRPDVDPTRLLLLGWSHGAWSIMDLMTMPLTRAGEAGLADPSPQVLDGVRGAFLLYPWSGPTALSRTRQWVRTPDVYGVVATRDHLATLGMARAIYAAPAPGGRERRALGTRGVDPQLRRTRPEQPDHALRS